MPLRSAILPILPRRASILDLPILPFLAPRVFQPWPSKGRHSYSTTTARATSTSTTQSAEQRKDVVFDIVGKELGSTVTEQEQKFLHVDFQPALNNSRIKSTIASDGDRPETVKSPREQLTEKVHQSSQRRRLSRPTNSGQSGTEIWEYWSSDPLGSRSPARTKYRSVLKRTPTDFSSRRREGRTSYFLRFSAKLKVGRIGKFVARRLSYRKHHSRLGAQKTYQRDGKQSPDPSIRLLEMNYEGNFIPQYKWLARDKRFFSPTLFDKKLLHGSSDSLKEEWGKLDFRAKGFRWPRLMFLALDCYPSKILKFINATYCAPYPSPAAVCDSLDFVILHYLLDLEPSHENHSVYLYKTIVNILLRGPANYTYLSQNAIYHLILRLPSPGHVVDLYRSLERLNNPLTLWTLAQFASRLSRASPDYEEIVFEMLQRLGDLKTDFNTPMMESLCTTILLYSSLDAKIGHSEKFEYMLKCGLIPNIITYNVLLLKNLRAGDRLGSWRIFEMMNESGPEPDAYTYSTLLNDAKRRRDRGDIEKLMKSYNRKGMKSAHVVVDALHSTLFCTESAEKSIWDPVPVDRSAFREMLPYYCRHFHFEPLARLVPGLSTKYPQYMKEDYTQTSIGPVNLSSITVDPPKHALVVMITALLRGYKDPDTPKWFYEHWKKLVQDCDPFILEISMADDGHYLSVIYNSLLKSLGRHAINVPLCLKILGEMSKPLPADSPAEPSIRLPKPTVATWNILAELLMQHRQPRAAEKILTMMRERGIIPTKVTWRTLVKGYAQLQDIGMVINTADRQERAGYATDSSILRVIKTVSDRRALVEGLKVAEMVRLESDLKQHERELAQNALAPVEPEVVEEEVEPEGIIVEDMPLRGPANANSRLAKVVEDLKGEDPVEEQSSSIV